MNIVLTKAAAICLVLIFGFAPLVGQITYVSPGATGDGSSWANANGDLKSVLDAASYGDEIWVKTGTYYPVTCVTCTPTDRDQFFEVKDGVKVFGGFQGSESSIDQRNWSENLTILDGDLNQDNQPDSNAYTVVYFEDVSSATILDGFIIRNGNADSYTGSNSNRKRSGGGIYNLGSTLSNPIIRNTQIKNNLSVSSGAGMVNNGSGGGEASPRIENCNFLNNVGNGNGGAILNDAGSVGLSSPEIFYTTFQNNQAKYGAGVYNSALGGISSPKIVSCSFISNNAINYSGAIYNFGKSGGTSAPLIFNCLFYKNTASSAGAVYSLGSVGTAKPNIANSTFYGNHANTGGAVYCNESINGETEATITNCIFWNNTAGFDPLFHMSGDGTPKMVLNHTLVDVVSCDDIIAFLGPLDTLICEGGMIYDEYPMFVDTTNLNFRLEMSSPVINQGNNDIVNANDILFDMDSHIRIHNGLVDMGIYEYDSEPYQAPMFVQHPISESACEEEDVALSVSVDGTSPMDYQWSKNGATISGATSNAYTISNLDAGDAGDYNCRVISIFADTVFSNAATIEVNALANPDIEINASTTTICAGDPVVFNATLVDEGLNPVFEWKINGSVVFTGSDMFESSTLTDGDEVNCRLTSSMPCASPGSITSMSIMISVDEEVVPTVDINASTNQVCSGETIVFTANTTNEGASPVYEWKVNGGLVFTGSPTFTTNSLSDGDDVTCRLVSSVPCASPESLTSTAVNISVTTVVQPFVTISSSSTQICAGEMVVFNAVDVNGGTSPIYNWTVNGQATGTNSSTFSTSNLEDGAIVSCELTSSQACANPTLVNSNTVEIEVNDLVQPAVSINASSIQICAGDMIDFIATPVNAGTSPAYQWTVNGSAVGTNNPNFSSDGLTDGALVACMMTSSSDCASPASVNSNSVNIEVTVLSEPTVDISSSASEICSGEQITFTANGTNGGGTPTYEWFVDGQSVGNNSSMYTASDLSNGVEVNCSMTSSMLCASPTSVVSNMISPTVITTVQPEVTISASSQEACSGETITFTASTTNEGQNPTYQWMVNNELTGGNSPTFSSSTLPDGAEIYCEITSSADCANPAVVSSSMIEVQITYTVQPAIQISANASEICAGELVTFNAAAVNGGATPTYQWMVNGGNVGTNSAVFSTADLEDGSSVTCVLTSSADCTIESIVNSNAIDLDVANVIEPEIEIISFAAVYCLGDTAMFTASPVNGGTSPVYDWKVDGESVAANGPVFLSADLTSGALVECYMTSSSDCASPILVTSNIITLEVLNNVDPTVSISTDFTEVCSGDLITFELGSIYGGGDPVYDWLINGVSTGINDTVFSSDLLSNQDTIACIMASSEACVNASNVSSEEIIITVNPGLTLEIEIDASETSICLGDTVTFTANSVNQGSSPIYQWLVNEEFVNGNGSEYMTGNLMDGDSVSCVLVSSEFCVLNNNIQAEPALMAVDSCLVSVFDELNSKPEMSIFPNPTTGDFVLKYQGESEIFELFVQDMQGRILKKENINTFGSVHVSNYDISSFASGIYFVKIVGLQNSFHFKIFLKK